MKKFTSPKTLSKKQIGKRLNEAIKQKGISLEEFENQMVSWRLPHNI